MQHKGSVILIVHCLFSLWGCFESDVATFCVEDMDHRSTSTDFEHLQFIWFLTISMQLRGSWLLLFHVWVSCSSTGRGWIFKETWSMVSGFSSVFYYLALLLRDECGIDKKSRWEIWPVNFLLVHGCGQALHFRYLSVLCLSPMPSR